MSAVVLAALGASAAQAAPTTTVPYIKVDQFGYLTGMNKVAIVVDPQVGYNAAEAFSPGVAANQYQVRRWADDVVVLSGTLLPWKAGATHAQSGDRGWHFDFSALTTAGAYYVYDTVNKVGSGRFEIGPNVYDAVLKQAMRTYYYQRLNTPKVLPYAEAKWTDTAAFEGLSQDRHATSRFAKGNAATVRDLSGGWMDAGDTNKYTTFAQSAVLQLLDAYRMNPRVFGDNFGIPESGNGVPDVLDEVKWELEFLKRMQNATGTGGLFLKVGVDGTARETTPLSADTSPRYYLPECTSSTLAGSAMFAAASVTYKGLASQAAYAADLLTRAEAAWVRAKATTFGFTTYQTQCDDLDIRAGDADVDAGGQLDSALLAAIALYEATGKAEYRTFVEANYTRGQPYRSSAWWWSPYSSTNQVALLRYAGLAGVSATVATDIRSKKSSQDITLSLDDFNAGTDLYRAHISDNEFNWGHNLIRANAASNNLDFVTVNLNTAKAAQYRNVAEQHLHWLHGANPLGLVMLSNMGAYGAESSINEIYHSWFSDGSVWDNARTSAKGPAPGYLVGGPNPNYSGSVAGISNQPRQKAYKDWNTSWPENSWEISEPAIYSQAAYVHLLARLMVPTTPDTVPPTAPGKLAVVSALGTSAVLKWNASTDNVGVTGYDLHRGTTLLAANLRGTTTTLTNLNCATLYALTLRARDAAGNASAASNTLTFTTAACPTANTLVYGDALGAGWSDWSWATVRDYANTTPVRIGARSLKAGYASWGGLSLRHATGIPVSATSTVRFWAYSPVTTPLQIYAQTSDDSTDVTPRFVTLPARVWTEVVVTRSQLGNPNLLKRLTIQLYSAAATTVYLDEIRITR
ncbi:glycoside hydrolase family 9 protein [Sphaerotilus sp.]|uniref:glycoside hydrolase family 9 protein n=1 Tax=Sphaerotilus sp. TaxID=2093942 RepID=UPI002ACE2974|nr:glycoside hydrolase family 9 protein [Sphaerotilus sp.]MDZ7857395.1 glycoside hydrolase family 9 protein [Sphaerotilus sp.]